jgi:hypothetical protein
LAGSLLALLAMLAPLRLWADDETVARANVSGVPGDRITSMSGGVGDEARAEMRHAAGNYNVHVMFSARGGRYLAGIPYSVGGRHDREVYSGISEGPLLYLKLAPGSYQLVAEIDGTAQSKRIQVPADGGAIRVSFVGHGD